jgi:aminomethyltransferase
MERLLDLDSGREFNGRDALLKIRQAGVRRRIVGVELIGKPLEQGTFTKRWPIIKDGQIGDVLVALHSPRLQKNIGYAMVAIEHSNLDSSMTVDSPVGALAARVVEMPFVKKIAA